MEMVTGPSDTPGQPTYYLLRKEAMITGRDLKNARVGVDESNRPQINFSLNATATDRFGRETGRNIGRQLAIVLDNTVYSAPTIQSRLGSDNRITGRFTTQEADELVEDPQGGRPAGDAQVPAGADRRRLARPRLDPRRRPGLGRGDGVHHDLHARLLPPVRPQRDRGPRREPPDRARGHGLHERDPHPARHRRHHPHRRRRGRHERARVRADPRGAAQRQDRARGRAERLRPGAGSRSSTPTRPRSSPPPSSSSSAPGRSRASRSRS